MPLKPMYCSQCSHEVVTREIDGRERVVCPACETVFYENPLPVAAAVVLNERREVLLVKRQREPRKGEWCLPMGFAELGETITEAALRELKEETGVEARVLRLLDLDSHHSSHYGDLLITTYEMQKVAGRERPGDDADDVHYFPIGQHPPLAFSSNEKALRVCAMMHQEGWEIHDSFVTLQRDEDRAMLSDALVLLIEEHAETVADVWLNDVCANSTTPSYRRLPRQQLRERAVGALSQFGRWLKGHEAADEVSAFYVTIGRERRAQGFEMHEVLSSLSLLKKHIHEFARSQGMWERPIDVYRVLELNRRMVVFFDQAMYHAARGFGSDSAR